MLWTRASLRQLFICLALIIAGLAPRAWGEQPIEVRLLTYEKKLSWGENALFHLTIINQSSQKMILNRASRRGLRALGNGLCVRLVVKSRRNQQSSTSWSAIRRSSNNIQFLPSTTTLQLNPGEAIDYPMMLYNDIGMVGNLPIGKFRIRPEICSSWRFARKQLWHSIYQNPVVYVNVEGGPVAKSRWIDFWRSLDNEQQNNNMDKQDLISLFLKTHPQAPMAPMLYMTKLKHRYHSYIESGTHPPDLAQEIISESIEIANNEKQPIWIRSRAAEIGLHLAENLRLRGKKAKKLTMVLMSLMPYNKLADRYADALGIKEKKTGKGQRD